MREQREKPARRWVKRNLLVCLSLGLLSCPAHGAEAPVLTQFRKDIQPLLAEYCYDCHGDGSKKGEIAFDELKSADAVLNHDLWLKVLKNVRAGIMPPPKKSQPSAQEKQQLEEWIKNAVFKADPLNPDPGRVTVRRLNRVEYRNTVRDLLGVDFETDKEFPPDDAGHGFDNIGDVLTLPPMLLEKYLTAAKTVVARAVPTVSGVPEDNVIPGKNFTGEIGATSRTNRTPVPNALVLSYYEKAVVTNLFKAKHKGQYQLLLDFAANERFVDNQFDYNKCRLVFKADGRELHSREYTREGAKAFHYEFDQEWDAGEHELIIEVIPLTPDQRQVRSLTLRIDSVTVRGPLDEKHWVRPKNFEKFFTGDAPNGAAERRAYARKILEPFVRKAYRQPVDANTIDRVVTVAEATYTQGEKTVEAGIAQAMVAVLASPRFLFREESAEPARGNSHPFVDEFALASRLSYFFWSSMPDEHLFQLAGEKKVRASLDAQVKRMLEDPKSEAFIRNFVGQWLQTRDIETVQIDARQVLNRERTDTDAAAPPPDAEREKRMLRFRELRNKEETNHVNLTAAEKKELQEVHDSLFGPLAQAAPPVQTNRFRGFRGFRGPRVELTGDLRRAMRQETEKTFEYIVRENRSLLEILDSDYTFLNERLARHYGLTNLNVTGDEMVLVKLPPESSRGGVITHGSVLAVTSNPTRTSPVKRGLFILDNLLGTPPPPPPPDIPPLEDAAKAIREKKLTLRETLALHREQPLCSSCHNRMDSLGLALENFNAMGMWRTQERGQPIDATGTLMSGENFSNIAELKKVLATNHATEFYRTMTEKLLTYALGRGLEYHDVATVDAIVERLRMSGGRPSELLSGIVRSAPFQRTRASNPAGEVLTSEPTGQRADARTK